MSNKRDQMRASTVNKQHEKFVDKARELGCDEDEAAFEERLKRIVPKKPKQKEKAPKK